MILEQLIPILQDAGVAHEGVDLFLYFMPATIVSGVLILPALPGTLIDPQLPNYRNRDSFQVICRDGSAAAALARAQLAFTALTLVTRRTLAAIPDRAPAVLLNYLRPRHDPLLYARQPSGAWEASVNFVCSYVAQAGVI